MAADFHNKAKHVEFPCGSCDRIFNSRIGLEMHTASKHKGYPCSSCESSFDSQSALEEHAETHILPCTCSICNRAYSSQRSLEEHAVTEHMCSICHEGDFYTPVALLEHLAEHQLSYPCPSCNLKYGTQEELERHYIEAPNDVHPTCRRCPFAFKDEVDYAIHLQTAHPKLPCNSCGETLYVEEMQRHYLDSSRHPTCVICNVGFIDQRTFTTTQHGEFLHPEMHCDSCQWQFDSAEALQRHQRHFASHPKCIPCNVGFADFESHTNHIISHHDRKESHDEEKSPESKSDESYIVSGYQVTSSISPVTAPDRSDRGNESMGPHSTDKKGDTKIKPLREDTPLYASSIPLPKSSSGHSSSSSQNSSLRAISKLSFRRTSSSPKFQSPRVYAGLDRLDRSRFFPSPPVIRVADDNGDVHDFQYPEADVHSRPASSLSLKGEPEVDHWQTTSFMKHAYPIVGVSQFMVSPPLSASRLQGMSLFSDVQMDPYRDLCPSPSSPIWQESLVFPERNNFESYRFALDIKDDDQSSLSVKSPQVPSPPMKLPSQYDVSPMSTSQWSPVSVSSGLSSPKKSPETNFSPMHSYCAGVAAHRALQESETRNRSPEQSGYLSAEFTHVSAPSSPLMSVSPMTTSLTPDYLKDTQECYSETVTSPRAHFEDLNSPARSPALPSPVLSSANFSAQVQGQKREVHFEDSILSERLSEDESIRSGASSPDLLTTNSKHWASRETDPPRRHFPTSRTAGSIKASRLPRRTSPGAKSMSSSSGSAPSSPIAPRYHCRICRKDPCENLTSTLCGHLFCNRCITEEVIAKSSCPVCKTATLLYCLFRIDTSG
ncbi:hypothetical protein SERLADRAFT_491696 [Serpula lacrymans var. lacrymans S7.9]|uniref:RING-type domain-containing protein n=1 Tax=Serpula lacrymans var. lacrymans (strain S7.9) TaxID=578457 RepID=F8NI84_SERL9|nr:uncharacterized protein SERLADRAFT_491696 [Serpula lacrymans var. lacrymans S7.9]EGO30090.1 hypothetical protein SERLADRAFT_491696 [Serpula lacrymans var. lacrymans S7.9]